jgi:3-phosphoshikimate 1-carboxyvinyltransferase
MKRRRQQPPLSGRVAVPGDKSISHRALILAALASGESRIEGLGLGADVRSTILCLEALGASIEIDEDECRAVVRGGQLREPASLLDAGNSGTTLRLLLGVAAGIPGLAILTGDDTLRRRPMLRVVVPLREMGADVDGRAHGDLAPLAVRGRELQGVDHRLRVASAQVKSAILLAGLGAEGTTSVTEPQPSRDHTERMLAEAGVELERGEGTVSLRGPQEVGVRDWNIPGDISSALFLIVAALIRPGSDLTIEGVGLNPTRAAGVEMLERMGASLEISGDDPAGPDEEPVGDIRARYSSLTGATASGSMIPRLIDEIPILAIAGTQAEGTTDFSDASELRHKESDRIDAMVEGIRRLGGDAEARPDGFSVHGPTSLSGGEIDSRGDHRVALAFAVAGLVATGPVTVKGWASTNTSFPEFLDLLGRAIRSR